MRCSGTQMNLHRRTQNSSAARLSPITAVGPTNSKRRVAAPLKLASSSTRPPRQATHIRSSARSTEPQLQREPGQPALAFAGWMTREMGEKLLNLTGHNVDEALKAADTKGFKPFSLGCNLKREHPLERVGKSTSARMWSAWPREVTRSHQIRSCHLHSPLRGSLGCWPGCCGRCDLQRRGRQRDRVRSVARTGSGLVRPDAASQAIGHLSGRDC